MDARMPGDGEGSGELWREGGADLGSKPDKRAEGRRRRDRIEAVEKGLRVKTRQTSGS